MGGNRKIGLSLDFLKGSIRALQWGIDNLLDKGDTLFIIHVPPSKSDGSNDILGSPSGYPLIPLSEFRSAHEKIWRAFQHRSARFARYSFTAETGAIAYLEIWRRHSTFGFKEGVPISTEWCY